jgi:ketose-bisphosphate aldolase
MSRRVTDYMKEAYERGILIPAFNAAYPEMVKPICETLKMLGTYGMLEIARPDIEKFGAVSFTVMYNEYKKYADPDYVPIHQDHVPVIDEDGIRVDYKSLLEEALSLGFDSVMVDGSRLPLDENIRITREVAGMAHLTSTPVEAELGAVLGHESGPLPPYEELFDSGKGFTSPEDAERFVKETGVDWLSVAVGNIHGAITGSAKDEKKVEARLNIEHLKKLRKVTGVPLVLHGGSGVQREYILEAVKNGLAKLNIGTEIRQAYEKKLRETNNVEKAQEEVSKAMEYLIVEYYGIKGSKSLLDK